MTIGNEPKLPEELAGSAKETPDRTKVVIAIILGALTAVFAAAFVTIVVITEKTVRRMKNDEKN